MKINPAATVPLANLVDKGKSRFNLNAILYDGKTAVVTDGHQLTKVTDTSVETPEPTPSLVSIDTLAAIKRLPKLGKHETHEIQLNPNGDDQHVKLECFNTRLESPELISSQTCTKPTGNFPDYERIMPKDNNLPYRISFNARLLVKVLDTLIELADKGKNEIVQVDLMFGSPRDAAKFKTSSGSLEIESVVMPCRQDDRELKIGGYLYETLKIRRYELESGNFCLDTGKTWEESIGEGYERP